MTGQHDPLQLPPDLPVPRDDGACAHLLGAHAPALSLPSTDGRYLRVDQPPSGFDLLVVYAYPRTGRPGVPLPTGWDAIPGARGCTPESCGFRDHASDLAELGAAVIGLSTQPTDYQREAVDRLGLPFPLVSDESGELTRALNLPTFSVDGLTLLRRFTLVVDMNGVVSDVFYPVFPPDTHAAEVTAVLRSRRRQTSE